MLVNFKSIDDLGDLRGRHVLLRVDFNVPMKDGKITDDTRIREHVPTIRKLKEAGAKTIILSHFGRPKGQFVAEMSLAPVVSAVSVALKAPVAYFNDCVGEKVQTVISGMEEGGVVLLENLRFYPGEEANHENFAKELASLGDFYVNDTFSTCHRAHASVVQLPTLLPCAAGESLGKELKALEKALGRPERPVAALVGGAKVSTKLEVLLHLIDGVDHLIIGGGMANTFLAAQGMNVGRSLCEVDLFDTAREILEKSASNGCKIHLPKDVVVAKEFAENAENKIVDIRDVAMDDMILDVGPESVDYLASVLETCKTLIWNGPMGAFEIEPFHKATIAMAEKAAELTASGQLLSVAGGGDTAAALKVAGVTKKFSYVSTAGGAFLEWMEGKPLPGVKALEQ
ncbi:MAG: phosphoglycerate kinase [Kordiimonas sp.]|nr:phosphoglycerate kinase [Kordiimonas sp.]